MKIKKCILASLEKSYAVNAFDVNGQLKYLFASEVDAPCYCIDADTLESEVVWSQGGGTMGFVPIEADDRSFLAIQNFFPPFSAADSKIVRVTKREESFEVEDILALPYLHRFGLIRQDGREWLVLAQLCKSKTNKDDWTKSGAVYVVQLDQKALEPRLILDGQFHNHGFFAGCFEGSACTVIGSDQGAYALFPPLTGVEWRIEQLTDVPTGEVWFEDLDGDGKDELITIEAFHGTTLRVYHQTQDAGWQCVWTCPKKMVFAHALWCGDLFGRRCGVCGSRREDATLFLFWYANGEYCMETIEEGASASNVWVSTHHGKDCLLSANHGQNLCVMYTQG